MAYIDLHFHSIYSDGTYTPEELLYYAKKKELSAVSLTDHDTIKGLERARKQSEKLGIKFINGVEINSCCYVSNRLVNIHVLGYNFVIEKMNEYMKMLKALRDEHNDAIIRALRRIGICIDYADVEKQAEECILTRMNFARTLVKKGYASTEGEALAKYLHKGGSAYVECSYPLFSVVSQKIHEAGGIVSLAHPAEYGLNDNQTEILIKNLMDYGLEAIEVIHPSQDTIYSKKLQDIATKNNLAFTGGSDFHGSNDNGVDLGLGGENMMIPDSILANLF
ncbi:MAG: PHP domain-containing protein [Lachnospiraceae bacterium]|jgi:predicted metal-dependent phosphoesterase TrpH|nr:PHP domain-containing protein [Lachnospiraceae bacterium]